MGSSCQPTKKNNAGSRYGHVRAKRVVDRQRTAVPDGGRAVTALLATARPRHVRREHVLRERPLLLSLLLHLGEDNGLRFRERPLRVLLVSLQVRLPRRL